MSFLESVSGGYSRSFWSCWPSSSLFIGQQSGCGAETHRISGAAINQLMVIANAHSSGAVTLGATTVGELTSNKEEWVGKKIDHFGRSLEANVGLP